jgi:hypothetical protein
VGFLGLGLVLPETHLFLRVFHFLETIPIFYLGFLGGFDRVLWVDPTHEHPYLRLDWVFV